MDTVEIRLKSCLKWLGDHPRLLIIGGFFCFLFAFAAACSMWPGFGNFVQNHPNEVSRKILAYTAVYPIGFLVLGTMILGTLYLSRTVFLSIPKRVWQVAAGVVLGGIILKVIGIIH